MISISWKHLQQFRRERDVPVVQRETICMIDRVDSDGRRERIASGYAVCSERDRYERAVGRLISYRRAVGRIDSDALRAECRAWLKARKVRLRGVRDPWKRARRLAGTIRRITESL